MQEPSKDDEIVHVVDSCSYIHDIILGILFKNYELIFSIFISGIAQHVVIGFGIYTNIVESCTRHHSENCQDHIHTPKKILP